jgi:hypothetical protein
MIHHMTFAIPCKPALWMIVGVAGGVAGLALDVYVADALSGAAATWGGIGALCGVTVGVVALLRNSAGR